MRRKIKEFLKEKSFYRGLAYLFASIFQIMLIPVALNSLSSQLNLFQSILLMIIGIFNWFVFLEFIKIVEDKYAKSETLASPTFPTEKAINKDLTATTSSSPKSTSQTSLNPDINRCKIQGYIYITLEKIKEELNLK